MIVRADDRGGILQACRADPAGLPVPRGRTHDVTTSASQTNSLTDWRDVGSLRSADNAPLARGARASRGKTTHV